MITAIDGERAWLASPIRARRIDLVPMDVQMPVMDGYGRPVACANLPGRGDSRAGTHRRGIQSRSAGKRRWPLA